MNEKQLRAELDAVYRSTSWKITAPLRLLSALVQRYIIRPLSPRRWGGALVAIMLRQTTFVLWVKRFLVRFPRLQIWVRRFYHRITQGQAVRYVPSVVPSEVSGVAPYVEQSDPPAEAQRLSRASQLLYQELKRSVKRGA